MAQMITSQTHASLMEIVLELSLKMRDGGPMVSVELLAPRLWESVGTKDTQDLRRSSLKKQRSSL